MDSLPVDSLKGARVAFSGVFTGKFGEINPYTVRMFSLVAAACVEPLLICCSFPQAKKMAWDADATVLSSVGGIDKGYPDYVVEGRSYDVVRAVKGGAKVLDWGEFTKLVKDGKRKPEVPLERPAKRRVSMRDYLNRIYPEEASELVEEDSKKLEGGYVFSEADLYELFEDRGGEKYDQHLKYEYDVVGSHFIGMKMRERYNNAPKRA